MIQPATDYRLFAAEPVLPGIRTCNRLTVDDISPNLADDVMTRLEGR